MTTVHMGVPTSCESVVCKPLNKVYTKQSVSLVTRLAICNHMHVLVQWCPVRGGGAGGNPPPPPHTQINVRH